MLIQLVYVKDNIKSKQLKQPILISVAKSWDYLLLGDKDRFSTTSTKLDRKRTSTHFCSEGVQTQAVSACP